MRARRAPLAPAISLRLRAGVEGAVGGRRRGGAVALEHVRDQVWRRLRGGELLRLLQQATYRARVAAERLVLAAGVLGLPLLQPGRQRRRDEDRGVGAGADADEQREREVLERLAAEEVERADRQQRDERRREGARDRLPERNVRERPE